MEAKIHTVPQDFTEFSLPLPVCLLGEEQHLLGLGSVLVATSQRAHMRIEEQAVPEFHIHIQNARGDSTEEARALKQKWQELLGEFVLHSPGELEGLRVVFDAGVLTESVRARSVLASPHFGVALLCAALAHRTTSEDIPAQDIARETCGLLGQLDAPRRYSAARAYARAALCLRGGARFVECGGGTINVQQMIPPESLILVGPGETNPAVANDMDLERVPRALEKMGADAADLVASSDEELGEFFQLASDHLNDDETMAVYGLLRIHQLITSFLENLSEDFKDHDVLAERCDEESDILERYFGFNCAPYEGMREKASQAGALGIKATFGPAGYLSMLVLAPDRRDSVVDALRNEYPKTAIVPIDVDSDGILSDDKREDNMRQESESATMD